MNTEHIFTLANVPFEVGNTCAGQFFYNFHSLKERENLKKSKVTFTNLIIFQNWKYACLSLKYEYASE